jgi:hypothetical protein
MLVISDQAKRILFLSEPYCGAVHDYAILKSEFDPGQPMWFDKNEMYVDLDFLGIQKDYSSDRIKVPIKRKQRRTKDDPKIPFTKEEKKHNKLVSQNRVYVENAIGGMKRYWWLTHRLRCRDANYYSLIAGVAAGLWNFSLKA